jgi:hypothetical protein
VVLLAAALHACPDDPGAGPICTDDFCLDDPPRLEIEPSSRVLTIIETAVEVGASVDRPIRVVNTGVGGLNITGAQLRYTAPAGGDDGGTPALQLVPPLFSLPAAVYTKGGDEFPQGVEFSVRFTRPVDGLERTATLVIKSNDPAEPAAEVTIRTESGAPSLATDKGEIDFQLVPKGQTVEAELKLINVGSRTLAVSGFRVADVRFGVRGQTFEIGGSAGADLVVDLPEAIAIPPGESRSVTVTFTSDSPTPATSKLLVYSDDPDSGVEGHEVSLFANKSGPCILVNPRRLSFGGKLIGALHKLPVEITSCGTEALSLSGIRLRDDSSPDFEVDLTSLPAGVAPPTPGQPLLLAVNDAITINVSFVPDEVNPKDADNHAIPDEGTLVISSNAFESEVEVPIAGAGADVECPHAVITVKEGEEVIPQTVLHLSGTQSYAPFGSIVTYDWTVVQPDGSQETFVPSASDPEPIFAANVVGLYTFSLRVRDQQGTWSCDPERVVYQVIVQPDEAIHVELTWVTPGDPDETDTGEGVGSDLDLHFTHPNATGPDLDLDGEPDPWFDEDYDCFWHNSEPNWASFDPHADDDPGLDRDDTDGAGPENANLGVPEDDTVYRVGVHYWDDHGFGDVTANVRIFSYATLVYERLDVPLTERDMWCVAHVHWLTDHAAVTPCGEPDEDIVADYVNPFFFQP